MGAHQLTKLFTSFILILAVSGALRAQLPAQDRVYTVNGFKISDIKARVPITLNFTDNIENDTLYMCRNRNDVTVAVYRNIFTTVCKDSVCLPVELNIYWSLSGNYCGFELKDGNILTKYDHEPFNYSDYIKLNNILSDPQSILPNYTLAELAPKPVAENVDAVTGATRSEVRGYIIQGAAYTTHTLWNIVYGHTRDSIRKQGALFLTQPLADSLLKYGNLVDKKWLLDNLHFLTKGSPKMLEDVIGLLPDENYTIQTHTMSVLPNSGMSSQVQQKLVQVFARGDYGLKKMILEYLRQSDQVDNSIMLPLFRQMVNEIPALGIIALEMAKDRRLSDPVLQSIARLYKHKDAAVRDAAETFLRTYDPKPAWLQNLFNKKQITK